MISDENLIELNKRGLIPGPNESNDEYYQRIDFCEKFFNNPSDYLSKSTNFTDRIGQNDLDWVYAKLIKTYDIAPDYFVGYYSDKDLHFFQGACTWIFEKDRLNMAVLQLRKVLKNKKYFFYDHDEILVHEMAHLARMAFDEKNEEIFAYTLSSFFIRRVFGPIIEEEKEAFVFFILFFLSISSLFLSFISPLFLFGYVGFSLLTISYVSLGLFRLFKKKFILLKASKNLGRLLKLKKKVRATLFRMTDDEIRIFSKIDQKEILNFVSEKKEKSLRWRMIYLCYFLEEKSYG